MEAYLLTWNPDNGWENFKEDKASFDKTGIFVDSWNTVSKSIKVGDRVFLIHLGKEPRGICASGLVLSEWFEDEHYNKPNETANYIKVQFDHILDPQNDNILPLKVLSEKFSTQHWSSQSSGISIRDDIVDELELLWLQYVSSNQKISESVIKYQNEIKHFEGTLIRLMVNKYERDPVARELCIKNYGYKCYVCGFDFENTYGDLGKDFIHVHHKKPVSMNQGKKYEIDPINDLIPLCANCHSMVHRKNPPMDIEDLKKLIELKAAHNK